MYNILGDFMADEQINFRVDKDVKKAFDFMCKRNDTTASQLLRAFMRDQLKKYYKAYEQADFIPTDIRKTMKDQ